MKNSDHYRNEGAIKPSSGDGRKYVVSSLSPIFNAGNGSGEKCLSAPLGDGTERFSLPAPNKGRDQ